MIKKKLMMKRLWFPPEVYYAKGAVSAIKKIEENKILILINEQIKNSTHFEKIEKNLSEKKVFYEVFQNIFLEDIQDLKEKYRAEAIDVIIAIGGGSTLDPAKMLKAFLTNKDWTLTEIEQNQFLTTGSIKLVAIPTTPGTGSESTSVAVIKDKNGNKKPYINAIFIPDLVILDHNFLTTIPEKMLLEFCADIFAHAWEGSISIGSSTLLQSIAKSSLELLKNGIHNYNTDKQIDALGDILYAGHLAGIVQGNASVGVCHALAHTLEVLCYIPHSKGILFLIEPILNWIYAQKEKPEYQEFIESFKSLGLNKFKDESIINSINNMNKENLIDLVLKDPAITTTPIRMNKENLLELINWIIQKK